MTISIFVKLFAVFAPIAVLELNNLVLRKVYKKKIAKEKSNKNYAPKREPESNPQGKISNYNYFKCETDNYSQT